MYSTLKYYLVTDRLSRARKSLIGTRFEKAKIYIFTCDFFYL